MKIKLLVFLTLIFIVAGNIFAQKPEPPKPAVKPVDAATPAPAKLPPASEILANYVKAVGGREVNEKIKTRTMNGTMEISPWASKVRSRSTAPRPIKVTSWLIWSGSGS